MNQDALPSAIRVRMGESLVAAPLTVGVDRAGLEAAAALDGDVLLAVLARLDVDHVFESLQTHDPLSWHCGTSRATHRQVFWQRRQQLLAQDLPRPRRQPSPPSPRRPTDDDDHTASTERVVKRCPLIVTVDTLGWPPTRRVREERRQEGRRRTRSPPPRRQSKGVNCLWSAKRFRSRPRLKPRPAKMRPGLENDLEVRETRDQGLMVHHRGAS
jgi:hypothetical protein